MNEATMELELMLENYNWNGSKRSDYRLTESKYSIRR